MSTETLLHAWMWLLGAFVLVAPGFVAWRHHRRAGTPWQVAKLALLFTALGLTLGVALAWYTSGLPLDPIHANQKTTAVWALVLPLVLWLTPQLGLVVVAWTIGTALLVLAALKRWSAKHER